MSRCAIAQKCCGGGKPVPPGTPVFIDTTPLQSTPNQPHTASQNRKIIMKTNRSSALLWMAAVSMLLFVALNSRAQTQVLINAFNNSDEINVNNGNAWGNWFGTAFYQVLWDPSDASNNPSSGSMFITAFYPDSGIGGCCGPQFVVYNQNS